MAAYLVLEYTTEHPSKVFRRGVCAGVHTPLRQDGHYFDLAIAEGVADLWQKDPVVEGSKIAVVEILPNGGDQ